MSAIQVKGLRKSYGRIVALDGLDLDVAPGEVHGFLGPNGAGKSTTIRALLGQIRINGGSARIFEQDCWRDMDRIHGRIAYVPGDVALWPGLTGGECIDVLARFQGTLDSARRDDLIQRYQLDPRRKSRTYSKGNRQKVALIAAFSTGAELFILDEPTSGLDPLMEQVFQQCVREVRGEGRTVLLSSHILSEVENLCDRVTIIRQGRTVATGPIDQIHGRAKTTVNAVLPGEGSRLDGIAGVTDFTSERNERGVAVSFSVDTAHLAAAVRAVTELQPLSLQVAPPSLDELFLDQYRETQAIAGAAR